MKKLALVLVALSALIQSRAELLPGYVVNLEGDTLKGFIDYRNWSITPSTINFQNPADGIQTAYSPRQIRSFYVANELYLSFNAEVNEGALTETERLAQVNEKKKTKEVFLMVMISGGKTLLSFTSQIGGTLFYILRDNTPELLRYETFNTIVNGKRVVIERKYFTAQLGDYLNDCKTIQDRLKNAQYKANSLESVFENYYRCVNQSERFQKKTEKTEYEFGVVAGAVQSSIFLSGLSTPNSVVHATYTRSLNFTGGVFVDMLLPRNERAWSFYNELTYHSYNIDGVYVIESSPTLDRRSFLNFNFGYLRLNSAVRYRLTLAKELKLIFHAGCANGVMIKNNRSVIEQTTTGSNVEREESLGLNKVRSYEFGLVGGVGVQKDRFGLEFRFERSNGFSAYSDLVSSVNRFQALLSYKIR